MDSENSLPTTAPPRKLLTVVTPCYNEEANVREMSEAIRELFAGPLSKYDYEHIFIDNASRDRTASILRELAARDPRIKVIINTRNFWPCPVALPRVFEGVGRRGDRPGRRFSRIPPR